MKYIGLQVQKSSTGNVLPYDVVIFDKVLLDIHDDIDYDLNTGEITINKMGTYYIDWWVCVQSSLDNKLSFSIFTQTLESIKGENSNLHDEVSGNALIDVSHTPYKLMLLNSSHNTIYYCDKTPIKSNLTIIEVNDINSVIAQTGPTGDTGSIGPTGNMGIMGHTGDIGDIGPIGYTGLIGDIGAVGAIGSIGITGPIGATGPTGDSGATGSIGPTGDSGMFFDGYIYITRSEHNVIYSSGLLVPANISSFYKNITQPINNARITFIHHGVYVVKASINIKGNNPVRINMLTIKQGVTTVKISQTIYNKTLFIFKFIDEFDVNDTVYMQVGNLNGANMQLSSPNIILESYLIDII